MAESSDAAAGPCPECGGPRVNGLTCWEQLGMIGVWEFQDPELMAEHFLTVASYNLQHPAQFTDGDIIEASAWRRHDERTGGGTLRHTLQAARALRGPDADQPVHGQRGWAYLGALAAVDA